jgi:hypothetical protein
MVATTITKAVRKKKVVFIGFAFLGHKDNSWIGIVTGLKTLDGIHRRIDFERLDADIAVVGFVHLGDGYSQDFRRLFLKEVMLLWRNFSDQVVDTAKLRSEQPWVGKKLCFKARELMGNPSKVKDRFMN